LFPSASNNLSEGYLWEILKSISEIDEDWRGPGQEEKEKQEGTELKRSEGVGGRKGGCEEEEALLAALKDCLSRRRQVPLDEGKFIELQKSCEMLAKFRGWKWAYTFFIPKIWETLKEVGEVAGIITEEEEDEGRAERGRWDFLSPAIDVIGSVGHVAFLSLVSKKKMENAEDGIAEREGTEEILVAQKYAEYLVSQMVKLVTALHEGVLFDPCERSDDAEVEGRGGRKMERGEGEGRGVRLGERPLTYIFVQ
jgi:hypothetical protein